MKLVDADTERPEDEEEVARPTPPRPERRRVVVSLGLTIAVLAGTVVTIYSVFPERHNQLVSRAVESHQRGEPHWQLEAPSPGELDAWAVALLGDGVPVPRPAGGSALIGARPVEIVNRAAGLVRYRIGGSEVTFAVMRSPVIAARRVSRRAGDLQIEAWRLGPWSCVAVGPAATSAEWRPAVGAP